MAVSVQRFYRLLLERYGPQGWWPVTDPGQRAPTYRTRAKLSARQRFEVCVGAVLTQNTAWRNVVPALARLQTLGAHSPRRLLALHPARLRAAVRPAGYYNQKARYLRNLARLLLALRGAPPSREQLLSVQGVGPETADSILLYAYQRPVFVVDAYTRRIGAALRWFGARAPYRAIQRFFSARLPKRVALFNEYHALLVAHGKRFYSKKPYPRRDPLLLARSSPAE